jgi:hypothetical protein
VGTRYLSPLNFPYQSARVDAPGLRGPTELAIFVFGQRSGLSLPDPFRFRLSLKCVQGDSGPERQQEQAQNRSKRRMLLRGKHEYEEDTQADEAQTPYHNAGPLQSRCFRRASPEQRIHSAAVDHGVRPKSISLPAFDFFKHVCVRVLRVWLISFQRLPLFLACRPRAYCTQHRRHL